MNHLILEYALLFITAYGFASIETIIFIVIGGTCGVNVMFTATFWVALMIYLTLRNIYIIHRCGHLI